MTYSLTAVKSLQLLVDRAGRSCLCWSPFLLQAPWRSGGFLRDDFLRKKVLPKPQAKRKSCEDRYLTGGNPCSPATVHRTSAGGSTKAPSINLVKQQKQPLLDPMNSWEWTTWLLINTNQALHLWSFSNAILDDHFALNKMPWSSLPIPYVRYFIRSLPKKTSQKKRLLPRCQGRCMESLEMFHELRILLVKSSTFRSLGPRRWGDADATQGCRPRSQGTLSCGLSRCSGIFITWI